MRPPNPSKLLLLIVCITFFLDLQAQQKPEILWDNYGVPHIYGKTIEDTYFGFGWAQMHNHADLILQLYGTARGRAAEYWGEQFVESDRLTHLLRLPEEAPNLYARQTPESKKILDAFVAGMNAYALTDRGTWLSFKNRADLVILVEGDEKLFNQYGVMLVNPAKHPNVKKEMGQKFIDWVISPAGQQAIAAYKIEGEQLFFPNYPGGR